MQPKYYKEKYEEAKKVYLQGELSLTKICQMFHIDRGTFSQNLKKEGIQIVNKQNITKFNECFFDKIDTEEKAYWLGFLYADGAISKSKNTVELSLKASDVNHLKKFVKDLDFTTDKHIYIDSVRCRVQITNKHLKESLMKLGCTPQKSFTITFPNENQVSNKYLYDFIRGYIDGDGSVMIGKNHKGIYNKPRLNILGTKDFIQNLLLKTNWREQKIQHHSNVYSIEWGGKYVLNYLDQLYENASVYLDRKYKKYLELKSLVCRS